ncbi:hypothetical protein FXO38_28343 [Capsicum annuum]|nr:hypothetical protein FXO38_28343 [Capsicum annuum]KAF3630293.1 hypothetical protein FXO37_28527 [Capsicum annuum]
MIGEKRGRLIRLAGGGDAGATTLRMTGEEAGHWFACVEGNRRWWQRWSLVADSVADLGGGVRGEKIKGDRGEGEGIISVAGGWTDLTARIWDFTQINPPLFSGSKSDKDPQELLDMVQKGNMSVKEYSLKFTQLARYAPNVVSDDRFRISKLIFSMVNSVVKECSTTMLIKEVDLSRLMDHALQIKWQKFKEKEKENKRARISSFSFAQSRSESCNRHQFHQKYSALAPSSASALMPRFKNGNQDRAPGFKTQGSVNNGRTNPLCQKYGRNHQGVGRAGSDICFGCENPNHRLRECWTYLWKGRNDRQQGQTNSSVAPVV